MRQNSYEIGASKKKLRLIAGGHYIALPMKIKKADVKAKLNADEVLEAGTLITKDGKVATTTSSSTNVYGILYQDVSFKGSMSADGVADNGLGGVGGGHQVAVVIVLVPHRLAIV